MQFDLSRTIARVLATAVASAVTSGCFYSCPEAPDLTGSSSRVPQGARAELEQALTALQVTVCDNVCQGDGQQGSTCERVAGQPLGEGHVVCAVTAADGTIEESTFEVNGVDELVSQTVSDQCDSLCTGTSAYQAYLGAGFLASEVAITGCSVEGTPIDDYDVVCTYSNNCAAGRAPAGLLPPVARDAEQPPRSALGAYWASMAFLEQASILAFEQLAAELQSHGAPTELVHRALAAAEDERVHAGLCGTLAARHGAVPEAVRVAPVPPRSLLEIALHNRRHGCVAESFAALQAHFQALHTLDTAARVTLEQIGRDETRHGQLAWDIDVWARTALAPELHPLLDRERDLALTDLVTQAPASAGPLLAPVGLHQPLALRAVALAFCDDVRAAA